MGTLLLVAPVVLALITLGGIMLRVARRFAQFEYEHKALMTDLKKRTEHIEHATPGIVPLPETPIVREITNGDA